MIDRHQLVTIIATALRETLINRDSKGTMSRIFESNDESTPFAKAALDAIDEAGFEIVAKKGA